MSYKRHALVIATLGVGVALAAPVSAATLTYEQTSAGRSVVGPATSYLSLPTTDTYTRSFNAPTTGQVGTTGFGFYDDFVFSVATSSIDAITSTIDFSTVLGISNLQVRLYNFALNPNPPVISGPPSGGVVDGWSNTLNLAPGTTQIVNVIPQTGLSAGTYVLEVRGNVTGQFGGSYTGTLNLVPTPIPAALPLMLSGLGLFGFARRKSQKA